MYLFVLLKGITFDLLYFLFLFKTKGDPAAVINSRRNESHWETRGYSGGHQGVAVSNNC